MGPYRGVLLYQGLYHTAVHVDALPGDELMPEHFLREIQGIARVAVTGVVYKDVDTTEISSGPGHEVLIQCL